MKLTVTPVIASPCPRCKAKPGEVCIVTLAPEVGPLSVKWYHPSRERASLE